jgi:predicted RNA binding protein YcfA (HicA-like mRNA interferase family)
LSVRAKRDVEVALKKKGFKQDEGDHHWFFFWTADGKKTTVRTKTSHGSTKDLGDGLLKEMARQVRVSKVQFLDLIDCPMSREQYQQLLEDGSYL